MGKPKPLLRFKDRTFLEQIIAELKLSDTDRITVVLGAEAETVRKSVDLSIVNVVINKDYRKGQLSSLVAAIKATPPQTEAILVCLVDMPFITTEVVNKIIGKFRETNAPIIVPVFNKKRGHPTLFARSVFSELLSAPQQQGARFVLRAACRPINPQPCAGGSPRPQGPGLRQRILELQTSESGILIAIDTPDEYKVHFGTNPQLVTGKWLIG